MAATQAASLSTSEKTDTVTIWDFTFELSALGLATWLLKDASWAMLCPLTAIPCAVAALCIEAFAVAKCPCSKQALRVHKAVLGCWLLGNVVWMSTEFCFYNEADKGQPGRQFPWVHTPLLHWGSDSSYYDDGIYAAQGLFLFAAATLFSYYVFCCVSFCLETQQADDAHAARDLVFGWVTLDVYHYSFIGAWVMKDYFWCAKLIWPAFGCSAIVVFLVLDVCRRCPSAETGVELVWVLANTLMMCAEDVWDNEYLWPRIVAAGVFLFAVTALVADVMQQQHPGSADERTLLF